MQNLILKQTETIRLLDESTIFNKQHDQFVFDGSYNVAYIVSNFSIYSFHLDDKQIIHRANFQSLLQNYYDDGNNYPTIVYCRYIIEDELLFILFTNGLIINYDTVNDLLTKKSLDSIDDTTGNIDDAKFSYDQELLVVNTSKNVMLLFNKLWVLKSRYDLNVDEYGANEMININWGSKETQFHGQGMRDHRHRNIVDEQQTIPLIELDDRKCFIDWKHDDYHYTINFLSPKGYRLLKIFNRDGILQHTSESIPGLQKVIAWKPSGSLIASAQLTANSYDIIFFEKNGLKHGQFKLPSCFKVNEFQIETIAWSYDSSILLVAGFRTTPTIDTEDERKNKIQEILFFTQNNYHWYLKQKIQIKQEQKFIQKILCDEIEYQRLHMISTDFDYHCYNYELASQTTETGTVLLIEGNQLNISDMNSTCVPPPLYTYAIKFTETDIINQICYRGQFLAVFLNDMIMILKLTESTIENVNNLNHPIVYQFENISLNLQMIYLPVFYDKIQNIDKFLLPLIDNEGRIFGCIDSRKIVCFDYRQNNNIIDHQIEFDCHHMLSISDRKLLLIDSANQFYQFDCNGIILPIMTENPTTYDGKIVNVLLFNNHTDDDDELHFFILTKNYSLYHNEMLIMKSNVNSILLHSDGYLLFTTIDNKFYCWPIKDFNPTSLQRNFPGRNLECGSKLLAISESNSRVIVELPRGNLEAFCPRILLLDLVDKHLDSKRFVKAFEILRKNRINLNYICDYNFEMFIENCRQFIEQLDGDNHIDWLCLLLFDLSPSNLYHIMTHHEPEIRIENKINRICDKFLETLTGMDEVKFIKPILLCHVKKDVQEIDEALYRIYRLNDGKLQQMAIKFLLSIVDLKRLLEEALGTYDFDLLLMVVSKSNKDPKEFQMLIEDFLTIEDDNYRKYRIDLYLHRYRKCLQHLQKCPDKLDEALQLIQDKNLFKDAIEIYGLNQQQQQQNGLEQIWNVYGDYLYKKCYYEEAGIVYNRAKNYLQAFKMYVQSGNWNQACICARKTYPNDNDDDNYKQLLRSLKQNLLMNGNYNAAAYICDVYLENPDETFIILVKGHLWYEAIEYHHKHQLNESLMEKEFIDEMLQSYNHMIENLNDKIQILNNHLERLKELQENTRKFEQNLNEKDDNLDTYSDTSSVCSDTSSLQSYDTDKTNQTLKTNISHAKKQKRKEQRKYLLKKGSTNEDLQIIFAIKELIKQSSQLFQQGRYLIRILYERFYSNQSKQLQQILETFENHMNNCIEFIWKSNNFNQRLENDEQLRSIVQIPDDRLNYKLILN
uniref:Elongator complex protein 1 n=1 Tax=Dermatophagoides pteronyssinus TaxID=6956 RepID=A0A6P6XPK6_DERPT|nr:elongator complex protein 1-like isoform X2 [Dermatophagoides pteronyssinus]